MRYAIEQNFVANGFSMYSGESTPFQIDANFGLGGAILSMLVVDLPAAFGDNTRRSVVLGPAIPASWAGGSVKGLRLRGGGSVDFSWNAEGQVRTAKIRERRAPLRIVDKNGNVLAEI
jgi:alpha-L-fucosidase 2